MNLYEKLQPIFLLYKYQHTCSLQSITIFGPNPLFAFIISQSFFLISFAFETTTIPRCFDFFEQAAPAFQTPQPKYLLDDIEILFKHCYRNFQVVYSSYDNRDRRLNVLFKVRGVFSYTQLAAARDFVDMELLFAHNF